MALGLTRAMEHVIAAVLFIATLLLMSAVLLIGIFGARRWRIARGVCRSSR